MKKILMTLIALALMVGVGFAAEELVTGEITDVVQATDKNGANYTRLIVNFDRTLEGNEYSVGLPVMGFGEMAAPTSELAVGDTLNAICSKRTFQDRESYTIIRLLN